ncbi:MAG: mechanosensitive ion channel domain-containing protein [Paracoccaceae bacterium]
MDLIDPSVIASADGLWKQILEFLVSLTQPYRLWQVGIVLGLGVLAYLLGRALAARLDTWLRHQSDLSVRQVRAGVLLRKRLPGVLFALFTWTAVLVISQISPYPSRRYIVELVATIATALVLIGLVTRLIRNRFLRRIVSWAAWIYVTLMYLGFLDNFTAFLNSMAINFADFRLSALSVIKALIVTGALVTGARILTQGFASRVRRNADISPSVQVLAVKMAQLTAYGAAVFIGLKAVGFDLTGLAVLSGAVGVGLGFGLQKVVSNLVSGVIILLDKSIKPGDVISIGDTFGWIESLGARYVSVVTRDGKEYLIPNEDLITGQVVNWSHSNDFVRIDLTFGTSYSDDPHLVRKLAIEAALGAGRVLQDRPAVCHITGFGDSSVDYILRFWISDPSEGLTNVRGNVYLALWDTFKENGISIPFPQREVRMLGQNAPPIQGA